MKRFFTTTALALSVTLLAGAALAKALPEPPPNGNYLALYQQFLAAPPHKGTHIEQDEIFEKLKASQVPTPQKAERIALDYTLRQIREKSKQVTPQAPFKAKASSLLLNGWNLRWEVVISDSESKHPRAYVLVEQTGETFFEVGH